MRLPESAHTDQPWRIHDIAPDFDIEDVWQFRMPGAGPDDFPTFLAALTESEQASEAPGLAGILFKIRWKLGEWFGWDDESTGTAHRVTSLRTRLPADLRDTELPTENKPLTPLYILPTEYAAEIANSTMHGVMHLGWTPDDTGYHLHMAVLVKPNGRLGRLYMALIKPFRYGIVYPAMTRRWERVWNDLAVRP
ncbi:DUF2867 domain-containing protein [Nocardia lasii]|uniref:DUF2867 domain-containing protein n=1 Tax=Nocardia lasii TaxID=1616107 RepID=A0ABW1JS05_9NOCA